MRRRRTIRPTSVVELTLSVWLCILLWPVTGIAVAQDGEESLANLAFLGHQTYQTNCSRCHGEDARGGGSIAQYLDEKPSDLTQLKQNNGGVFPSQRIYQFIDGREPGKGHRSREMPVWGKAFLVIRPEEKHRYPNAEDRVKEKIDQLVAYLTTIQE